jgi:small subunit ribosomal protein S20
MEEKKLANIKSAKKRILTSRKKEERNKSVKSAIKTAVKKVDAAVQSGDKTAAEASLKAAESELVKASVKGVLHKNTSSRKVSRLSKSVSAMK